ncbi:MAG: F0F1 ATP synthase subunit gamma [Pseudomonadales bacterium]|jgi:F-type H+-transporting ATPase subunit gamma|nr:F0F1 ATP synthase subunit gamma [Pseudomonadales bacterium]
MSARLADVSAHIQSVQQISAVVGAMRGLAGARAQKGRVLLPAIRAYAEVSGKALARLLTEQSETAPRPAAAKPTLLVFGAQQGFAGAFADQVLDAATARMAQSYVMMAGARSAALARQRGLTLDWLTNMPDRPASVAAMASTLVDALYAHITASGSAEVNMIVPIWHAEHGAAITERPLLPLDRSRFQLTGPKSDPPLRTLPAPLLVARLAEEYVFAQVCEAAMEAYVAENQARVQAMVAAKMHIEGQLKSLDRLAHQVRQDEITDEVIELAAARHKHSS